MVEVRGAYQRLPIYIAVLLMFKNRLIRYGIIVMLWGASRICVRSLAVFIIYISDC